MSLRKLSQSQINTRRFSSSYKLKIHCFYLAQDLFGIGWNEQNSQRLIYGRGSLRMDLGPIASALSGNLLEMQVLRPHTRPTTLETLKVELTIWR